MCDERIRAAISVLVLSLALSVHGATLFKLEVSVQTTMPCASLPDEIKAVVAGDERRPVGLRRAGACTWKSDDRMPSFSSKLPVSIRLGTARSGCHRADVDVTNVQQPVGLIDLCCTTTGATLVVERDPNIATSYLRLVDARKDGGFGERSMPVDCTEFGSFGTRIGTVEQVIEDESVRLQFRDDPDFKRFGLILEKFPDKPITRNGIAYRFIDQRAKGRDGSAARISPNAIELDARNLARIGIKSLKVTVK